MPKMDKESPDRQKVADAIRKLVKKARKHPWDINCGDCEDFSDKLMEVITRLFGKEPDYEEPESHWVSNIDTEPGAEDDPIAHAVTFYRGWWFDAEEPYGVEDWRHLPLCARALRERDSEVKRIAALAELAKREPD